MKLSDALKSLTMLLALPLCLAANAAETNANTQFGDWYLRCARATACDITHSIVLRESKQQVLLISVAYSPEQARHAIEIQVPLGVDLRRGIDLAIGAVTAKGVHVTRCELTGCYIDAMLGSDFVEAMKTSPTGRVTIGAIADKDASIEFSLKGFAEANTALTGKSSAYTPVKQN